MLVQVGERAVVGLSRPSLIFRVHNGAVAVLHPWMEAAVFKICLEKRLASRAAAGPSVLQS
jgi:hypothetical protein